jgi:ABC-2 type transport system ATP-binding protein
MPQILVEHLYKEFPIPVRGKGVKGMVKSLFSPARRILKALDGISFSIEQGELVGYIGPNGAGKSTTVKILSGILVPTRGRCEVNGIIPWKDRIAYVKGIGVVFGQRTQLWWDLPVRESFDLIKDIYRMTKPEFTTSFDELCALLDLEPLLPTPVRLLSLGQRMRCEIAASLLHRPAILFLDEPTLGLDALSTLAIRSFIKKINEERKVTVLLTTHNLDDIEALCRRIMVINKGKIFLEGTIRDLREKVTDERRMIVDVGDNAGFTPHDRLRIISREGQRFVLQFLPSEISVTEVITHITTHHVIRDIFIQPLPIEEIIARLYREHGE